MARIGIVFGLVLFGLTIAALSLTTHKSYTQFVPMMFGIPLLFCGVVALNPHRRGDAVLWALILMLGGLGFSVIRTIVLGVRWMTGGHVNTLWFELVVSMSVVCLVFVVIAENWRRRRKAERKRIEEARRQSAADAISPLTANPPNGQMIQPAQGDRENPYQTPAILNEPTSSPPSDDPTL